jgi:hypothetical protein
MCPCDPIADSNFHPPPSNVPGSAIQLPPTNIPFPPLPLNDLNALFQQLQMILPSGTLHPNFEPDYLRDIYGGINDLLGMFMPFFQSYAFFLPLLELILCIIEIICALLNPFKLVAAVRNLFRVCIPAFLALYPAFAIIIMIISLLLLIISLIEYLITRILQLIQIIIKNVETLALATQRLDNDSIIGITTKIGNILCMLQNLFVVLGAILLIIEIIEAVLQLIFKIPPCSDSNNNGCCTPDVCPAFIKNNSDIISNTGTFLYYSEVGLDSGITLPTGFPPIISTTRAESWQFYDPNLSQSQAFINIVNAYDLPPGTNTTFFPPGATYTQTSNYTSAVYTISFTFLYSPASYAAPSNLGVSPVQRYLTVANAIVASPPTAGVLTYDGKTLVAPFDGTLNLIGGVMQEVDGTPILAPNGSKITLNQFFHQPTNVNGDQPLPTDGIFFNDVSYDFNINHEVLLTNGLITLGCIPEVAADKNFINNTIGAQFNNNAAQLANLVLPDVASTQQCITSAITTYRNSISIDSTNTFQNSIMSCLNTLNNQAAAALTQVITAGFDPYTSTFTLDPEVQFTTYPIVVSVSLMETSGKLMTAGLPASSANALATQISASINFGAITPFVYDGYNYFVANLTSATPGNGNIEVAFDNNYISTLTNPTDIASPPSVAITSLLYTFVKSTQVQPEPYRDAGDVSREVNNGE